MYYVKVGSLSCLFPGSLNYALAPLMYGNSTGTSESSGMEVNNLKYSVTLRVVKLYSLSGLCQIPSSYFQAVGDLI